MSNSVPFSLLFFTTICFGLLAAIYPLSPPVSVFRPEWICLIMIYWVLHTPNHIGIGIAWTVGLFQGVLEGSVWGGHAFALAAVSYVCLMSYRRLRSYSLTQQSFWIFIFVGLHQMFVNWFQGFEGYADAPRQMLLSSLVTAAFWPLLVLFLKGMQRRYRIF